MSAKCHKSIVNALTEESSLFEFKHMSWTNLSQAHRGLIKQIYKETHGPVVVAAVLKVNQHKLLLFHCPSAT